MKKNQLILISLLCVSIIVLSACSGGTRFGGRSGAAQGGAPRDPFIGGTAALTIDFEDDSPPPEVTDDDTFVFSTIFRIRNDGEFTVNRDDFVMNLVGFDPDDFGLSFEDIREQRPQDDLQSTRRDAEGNIIEGFTTFLEFPKGGGPGFVPKQFPGNTEFTFRGDACYHYQTLATAKVCVLRDMINIRDNSICVPTGGASSNKVVYSSSAPVQVQNFRQQVVGRNKLTFTFDIILSDNVDIFWNRDSDTLPSQGFDAACPRTPRERREHENQLKIIITELPDDPVVESFRCGALYPDGASSVGTIRLVNGRRTVTCSVELVEDREDLEKLVGFNLQYNVRDFVEKEVLIKHLAADDDFT